MEVFLLIARRYRIQAVLCALALAGCVLAAQPFAETGITDDFSYIRTAQVLAQTGHIEYNGWATAMLGWQLLAGGLFAKLFGFSFTIVRLTTLLAGMATAFLLQRSMVRAGIHEWNATIGTLTLVLSPLFLAMSSLFLSDIWGMLAIAVCLYGCLRGVQAKTEGGAIAWICFAALGNAVVGTARQIAWLGVLVMVPSALWLLRRQVRVLRAGGAACLAGYGIVFGALYWFSRQLYSVAEPLFRNGWRLLVHMPPDVIVRPGLEIPMLMLPVLLMFTAAVRGSSRRGLAWLGAASLGCAAIAVHLYRADTLTNWLAPFVIRGGSILHMNGLLTTWPIGGMVHPANADTGVTVGMPEWLRLGLAVATIVGVLCAGVSMSGRPRAEAGARLGVPGWRELGVILGPFSAAYLALLVPRGAANLTLDRYVLPLVMVALVVVVRLYQERVRERLPVASLLLALVIAAGSVAATHDLFAMYRATLTAANEMRAAGVPRSNIDAGFEYNGWTQITQGGYVHQYGVRLPAGVALDLSRHENVCPAQIWEQFPELEARYSLSFDPDRCGGPAEFAPVVWRRWIRPREITVYVVKNPPLGGGSREEFQGPR